MYPGLLKAREVPVPKAEAVPEVTVAKTNQAGIWPRIPSGSCVYVCMYVHIYIYISIIITITIIIRTKQNVSNNNKMHYLHVI